MIKSFRHKGLEKFYKTGSKMSLEADEPFNFLYLSLGRLDGALEPRDMEIPGLNLQPVPDREGFWMFSVTERGYIVFRFEEDDICDVDYIGRLEEFTP